MKTITFKLFIIVLALFFSYSSSAQLVANEHFTLAADMAGVDINSSWDSGPGDGALDGTLQSADNTKSYANFHQDLETYSGEQSILPVKNRYTIIPNPSSGKSKLEVQVRPKDSQLMLFDLTGRLQLKVSIEPGQDKAEIDVSSLNKSIYILKVLAGEAVVGVEKLVIN